MPTWNDRRWGRQRGDDNAAFGERSAPRRWSDDREQDRDDVHAGPWSPYNGLARDRADDRRSHDRDRDRDRDRGTWGPRGRDYWLENDQDMSGPHDWSDRREDFSRGPENRWEDRRLGMGDRWRHRDDRDDDNRARATSSGATPWACATSRRSGRCRASGAWQREPRYDEMERLWSDAADHPWANQEHDEIEREARGEQYPSHTHGSWRDDRDRGWREERPRDDRRGGWNEQRYADQRGGQRHERGERATSGATALRERAASRATASTRGRAALRRARAETAPALRRPRDGAEQR